MTHDTDTTRLLERLAETFPERPAPLPDLVAAAHAGHQRRTRRNAAVAAVVCAVAVGVGVTLQAVLPDDGVQRSDRVADSREACHREAARSASSPVPQGPDYPTNAAGETYGGHSDGRMPALVAAVGDCGHSGYVRRADLDEPPPWQPGAGSTAALTVPLYESDGVTQVDTFTRDADARTPSPPASSGPDAADVQGAWTAVIASMTNENRVQLYETFRDLDLRITFEGDEVELFDGCDTVRTAFTLEDGVFVLTTPDALLGGPAPTCARSAPLAAIVRNIRHVTQSGGRTYLHLGNFRIAVVLTPAR